VLDEKYRRGRDENATRVISRQGKSEVAPRDSLSKRPRSDTSRRYIKPAEIARVNINIGINTK